MRKQAQNKPPKTVEFIKFVACRGYKLKLEHMENVIIKHGQSIKEFFSFKEGIGYRLDKKLSNLEPFCEIDYRTNGTDVSVDLVFVVYKRYFGERYKEGSKVIGKIPTTGKKAYTLQLYNEEGELYLIN